tara:strand:- start:16494 stop:16721 length:228 start_codon:yes stop_codon:yes gene_type:complete
MPNEEFLRTLFDQIQAYSSTTNVLGEILGFLGKVVQCQGDEEFIVDVSNALLKSGNAEIIGELPWDRFCRDMVQA